MRLKLYRASGMAEAMAAIRAELGVDALILASRRIGNEVEVTAALEPAEDMPYPPPDPLDAPISERFPDHAGKGGAMAAGMARMPAPAGLTDDAPPTGPHPAAAAPVIPPWIRPLPRQGAAMLANAMVPGAHVPAQPAPPRAIDPARRAALDFHAVPPMLATQLAHTPLGHAPVGQAGLAEALAAALRFAPLPLDGTGPPLLFTGPPGAGKTLTVARLATRLVLGGVTPMVITADGQRAGATEQLAAFTRLLQINLIVASHPVTLGRALLRRPPGAPVLIDAPGCDPFDAVQQAELAGLAATARARTALVLPGGLDVAEAGDLGAAFARLGARFLIATRLDLARRLGGVLAAAAAGPLALAEAGIGAGAADGLIPFTPDDLAARLLAVPPAKLEHRA